MAAPPSSRAVLIAAVVWLVAAIALGASGGLAFAYPPIPQLLIGALTLALLALFWLPTPFSAWAFAVDVRVLVLIHVTRFVGIYFLVLYARGELPWAFAVPGGWGDIAVAATALGVCALPRVRAGRGRGIVLAWNMLGLADILLVVSTAARLGTADPESMRALLRLPLSLLPTFLVPIIIATHLVIFARLWRPSRSQQRRTAVR